MQYLSSVAQFENLSSILLTCSPRILCNPQLIISFVLCCFFWYNTGVSIPHTFCGFNAVNYRVLTVHGSKDPIVPVEDALEFAKFISNHKLHIIEGADHEYTSHQDELALIVLDFLGEDLNLEKSMKLPITENSFRSRL